MYTVGQNDSKAFWVLREQKKKRAVSRCLTKKPFRRDVTFTDGHGKIRAFLKNQKTKTFPSKSVFTSDN